MWVFKYVANKFKFEKFQTRIHNFTFIKHLWNIILFHCLVNYINPIIQICVNAHTYSQMFSLCLKIFFLCLEIFTKNIITNNYFFPILWCSKGGDQCWAIIVFWPIINMHINWICMKTFLEFVLFSLSSFIYNQQMSSFMIYVHVIYIYIYIYITYWYMFMALILCICIYLLRLKEIRIWLDLLKNGLKVKKKVYNLVSLLGLILIVYHCQAFFSTSLVSELLLNYFVKVIINEKGNDIHSIYISL